MFNRIRLTQYRFCILKFLGDSYKGFNGIIGHEFVAVVDKINQSGSAEAHGIEFLFSYLN